MKSLRTLTLALSACLTFTGNAAEEGFTDLLAGDGIKNFKTYNKPEANPQWVVKDGELKLTGRGGGDLITKEQYENFDLRLEWKIQDGGNSGIFFGAKESNRAIYQDAVEMQILGNGGFPKLDDYHIAGAVYGLTASKRDWAKPAGEWNEVRIVKKDGKVQFFFNGHQTGDIDLNSEEFDATVAKTKFKAWPKFGKHPKGHIGFQDHGDSHGLAIRNLRIKEL